jgi:hypothetical protein
MQLVLRAFPIVILCALPALSALPAVSGEKDPVQRVGLRPARPVVLSYE